MDETNTMAYVSTDESDIDAFLEYAREKVAENDRSYDTASFQDFETLLQKCVENHFRDDDADSMASESSFSGYANEECGAKHKSAVLMKRDIMSDNAYHRMKGIIARKKKSGSESQPADASTEKENNDTSLHSIECHFEKFRMDPKLYFRATNDARNDSIGSDSSDSILDDLITRPRRPRRRPNKKKKRAASNFISKKSIPVNEQNISALTSDSMGKEKPLHSEARSTQTSSHNDESDTTDRSSSAAEFLIDTTNSILPSLVKKGIRYYDVPKIERSLERMLRKGHTIDEMRKVFDELLATRPVQMGGSNSIKQKGMALVHKLRAERKMALQAAFLRYSKEGKENTGEKHKNEKVPVSAYDERDVSVPQIMDHFLIQSPSSLSSSSFEETNRFRLFMGKTKRVLTHSFHHHDQQGLLQKHVHDSFWMNSSYSSQDEGGVVQKTSPFKIKFPRIKESMHYEELSTSSLTNDTSWNDSGDNSVILSSDFKNYVENTMPSSDHSAWSEISFQSDPSNQFRGFCTHLTGIKTQPKTYQTRRPRPIQCNESKTINSDAFDEIVTRNTPRLCKKYSSNDVPETSQTGAVDFVFESGLEEKEIVKEKSPTDVVDFAFESECEPQKLVVPEESPPGAMDVAFESTQAKKDIAPEVSPTGVMDFAFGFEQEQPKRDILDDVLTFVDEEDDDYVFTDKDESFVMKSPAKLLDAPPLSEPLCAQPLTEPVFLSPSRFAI